MTTSSPGPGDLQVVVVDDPSAWAAAHVARRLREALERPGGSGRATIALSGGSTVPPMLAALAGHDLAWERVDVLQVDERIAPDGHPDRNLLALEAHLAPLGAALHPMPVHADDPAVAYQATLARVAGTPAVLDLVQLGLGDDGHTASLVPGDPVLDVRQTDVAVTDPYRGRRRVTLTYPVIDRARERLWLVTGAGKRGALAQLLAADPAVPAGRVARAGSLVVTDPAAAGRR